jgi:hypothetical protein
MKKYVAVALAATAVYLVPSVAVAKDDTLEATRACMVRHGATRKPDGSVWLGGGRANAEGVRAKCRREAGYKAS